MANSQVKANPKKKSGFQGVRDAIWIIVACFILAVCFYKFVLGNPDNFVGGDPANAVKDGSLLGTVYKGGIVVPVIITLLFTVIALSIERYFALRSAFGKSSLTKFVTEVKAAINAGDMAKAQQLCDKQQGVVANVVGASLNAYKEMEADTKLKKSAKVLKIQQAHEEATQLEMPTLQMNMPILATIVTLGTLTALFGTVVGMIRSFAALASGGGGDSLALSEGISEALVNTASGILTSWFAVVAYNYFKQD
jgi:biopolymer transport protein ExbB